MARATLTVPAAEANRSFFKLLRAARDGARITITSHGEPVAQLGPVTEAPEDAEQQRTAEAHRRLVKHLESVTPVVVGSWNREDLYERE